jgi:hypothetical protein
MWIEASQLIPPVSISNNVTPPTSKHSMVSPSSGKKPWKKLSCIAAPPRAIASQAQLFSTSSCYSSSTVSFAGYFLLVLVIHLLLYHFAGDVSLVLKGVDDKKVYNLPKTDPSCSFSTPQKQVKKTSTTLKASSSSKKKNSKKKRHESSFVRTKSLYEQ